MKDLTMLKLCGMIVAMGLVAANAIALTTTMEHTDLAKTNGAIPLPAISLSGAGKLISLSTANTETSGTIPPGSETAELHTNQPMAICVDTSPTTRCGGTMIGSLGAVTGVSDSNWIIIPTAGSYSLELTKVSGSSLIPYNILYRAYAAALNASMEFRRQ